MTYLLPTVTTAAISNIAGTTATCGGIVTSNGGLPVTARGVCWSNSPTPTISNPHTSDAIGTGSFISNITGLTYGVTYYVMAYVTTAAGTTYGTQQSFTTFLLPTLTTTAPTNVSYGSATSGGNISSDGGATITARGVCWSTNQNPTLSNTFSNDGIGTGGFTSSITGLTPYTTYYVNAYATNIAGTSYGTQVSFTTTAPVSPSVTTTAISNIKIANATGGGNVINDGGATVIARGVCWNTTGNPTIADSITSNGAGTGSFISSIMQLMYGTTYYVKAYAINSVGVSYGNEVYFITLTPPVFDIDGNGYDTVVIGTQTWLVQNLRVTHLNNGVSIPNITNSTLWKNSTTPALCYYNNDSVSYAAIYGALYNWYAVNTNNLCPTNWHVPSYSEWETLITYLGGASVAGGKLKEVGTTHWTSPNTGATNSSGFTALPNGISALEVA